MTRESHRHAVAPVLEWPPVFSVPTTIDADLPAKLSGRARALLLQAAALCGPSFCGSAPRQVVEEQLQRLASEGRSMANDVARASILDSGSSLSHREERFIESLVPRHRSPDAFAVGLTGGIVAVVQSIITDDSLDPKDVGRLISAFFRIGQLFVAPTADDHVPSEGLGRDGATTLGRPWEQWQPEHLVIVALLDALILAHARAIAAVNADDVAAGTTALDDAGELAGAFAASLRLIFKDETGEMHSAKEQFAPESFLGAFNLGRRHLSLLTRGLWPLLQSAQPGLTPACERYWQALIEANSVRCSLLQRHPRKTPPRPANAVIMLGHRHSQNLDPLQSPAKKAACRFALAEGQDDSHDAGHDHRDHAADTKAHTCVDSPAPPYSPDRTVTRTIRGRWRRSLKRGCRQRCEHRPKAAG